MTKIKIYNPNLIVNARKLRKHSTTQERKLWKFIKGSKFFNLKFRRQFPIGPYIVDFFCVKSKLIIELDGSQHNQNKQYDKMRDEYLQNLGYKILRVWNNRLVAF